jgi:hypothetical protein
VARALQILWPALNWVLAHRKRIMIAARLDPPRQIAGLTVPG